MKSPQNRRTAQAGEKIKSDSAFRLSILFFSVFLLFALLIFRLGYLQIVKGEDFVRAIERREEVAVDTGVPRGRIFDSEGRVLVDNQPLNAITYTAMQSTGRQEMLETASKLAALIDQPAAKVTRRDKQDFYILLYPEKAKALVPEEQANAIWAGEGTEGEKQRQADQLMREGLTEEVLAELTADQLEVLAIYREMTSGYALSPQIIKSEGLTTEEFAQVSERLAELPGVSTVTDWSREKASDLTVLGSTTSPEEGIPASSLDYFLARGYSRNDRVGTSFLEQQYESVLQGQKSVVKKVTDARGSVVDTVAVKEGQAGKDLVLSIDSELQNELEQIVTDKLLELKKGPNSELLQDAYLVMMNPQTGEVLSLVGKRLGEDENGEPTVYDYAFGTFTSAYEMGSAVKGAMVLTGYSEGVLDVGEVLIDEPMQIKSTEKISSVFNRKMFNQIPMNDKEALARSSNIYMAKIALRLTGSEYVYNQGIQVMPEDFRQLRNSFAQFGLGVKTGIDLPGEGDGLSNENATGGTLLYQAIGQLDTYTPLQLAQYISTIANDGYRMEPHVVKEIRSPSIDGESLGPIETVIQPKVLNRIDNTPEEINQVKEGMRMAYTSPQGTAVRYFGDAPYTAAGKTGTAQVTYYGESGNRPSLTLTHVGFAPYENPEIAYAVVVPYITTDFDYVIGANSQIARAAVDTYFELKQEETDEGSTAIKPPYEPASRESAETTAE
ncbi:peptidoglycan D,D-transpeptidase FtsI family protein [Planococcus lenghuensis]|uniref:Penicillin-binding protein n=1 Tax=Planococcus lenghuensis TaxID=2213202 RepID=A0A1Q2KXZ6_9BACL|nr:penicillin-binding protein 2 [Planococcus lenghuensis]AQQ52996.1 penicillin-binding protein [Planococcus lenghuensis]